MHVAVLLAAGEFMKPQRFHFAFCHLEYLGKEVEIASSRRQIQPVDSYCRCCRRVIIWAWAMSGCVPVAVLWLARFWHWWVGIEICGQTFHDLGEYTFLRALSMKVTNVSEVRMRQPNMYMGEAPGED